MVVINLVDCSQTLNQVSLLQFILLIMLITILPMQTNSILIPRIIRRRQPRSGFARKLPRKPAILAEINLQLAHSVCGDGDPLGAQDLCLVRCAGRVATRGDGAFGAYDALPGDVGIVKLR